eukprot:1395030-Amorphochlora_amoeboformis.AAC.2
MRKRTPKRELERLKTERGKGEEREMKEIPEISCRPIFVYIPVIRTLGLDLGLGLRLRLRRKTISLLGVWQVFSAK